MAAQIYFERPQLARKRTHTYPPQLALPQGNSSLVPGWPNYGRKHSQLGVPQKCKACQLALSVPPAIAPDPLCLEELDAQRLKRAWESGQIHPPSAVAARQYSRSKKGTQ